MKNSNLLIRTTLPLLIFLAQIRAFCTKIIFITPIIPAIERTLFFLLVVVFIFNILTSKIKVKDLIIVVTLLFLVTISYLVTNSLILPYLLLLPFAFRGISFEKIIKTDLISKILIALFVFCCYFANLVEARVFYRDGIVREAFGFPHPNTLGYLSVMVTLEVLLLMRQKTDSIFLRVIIAIIPLYLCYLADSKTSQIAIFIALIYSIFEAKYKKKKNPRNNKTQKFVRYVAYLLPLFLILFSFVSTKSYSERKEWAIVLNEALSSRIYLQDYYDKHYDVSLFGEELTSDDIQKKPLDNGYYRILFNNGILGLIALLVIIELSLSRALRTKKEIAPTLILLLIYGLSELTVFNAIMTPFWTIAFAKEETKDEKEIPAKLA